MKAYLTTSVRSELFNDLWYPEGTEVRLIGRYNPEEHERRPWEDYWDVRIAIPESHQQRAPHLAELGEGDEILGLRATQLQFDVHGLLARVEELERLLAPEINLARAQENLRSLGVLGVRSEQWTRGSHTYWILVPDQMTTELASRVHHLKLEVNSRSMLEGLLEMASRVRALNAEKPKEAP